MFFTKLIKKWFNKLKLIFTIKKLKLLYLTSFKSYYQITIIILSKSITFKIKDVFSSLY